MSWFAMRSFSHDPGRAGNIQGSCVSRFLPSATRSLLCLPHHIQYYSLAPSYSQAKRSLRWFPGFAQIRCAPPPPRLASPRPVLPITMTLAVPVSLLHTAYSFARASAHNHLPLSPDP